jgi:hypothetical protein
MNDLVDLVRANTNTPTEVLDGVILTPPAAVTHRLQCVATKSAHAGGLVALAHVDGVCSVSKVKAARHVALLERANLVAWGHWQAEARRRHGFGDGFKRHRRVAKG